MNTPVHTATAVACQVVSLDDGLHIHAATGVDVFDAVPLEANAPSSPVASVVDIVLLLHFPP